MINNYKYQAGGTLAQDDPSYVERKADDDLYQALKQGQYCYVFNSRQMGKSSLGIRTLEKLQNEGINGVCIDLTEFTQNNSTPEQWYYSFLDSLLSSFNLWQNFDLDSWWTKHSLLSFSARVGKFFQEILLKNITEPIVIFIDELDKIKDLPFNVDDFFTIIRYFYNQRAINPELNRLNFVFLGVITPIELIKNPVTTPFNIGTQIELTGFTFTEVKPLIKGLESKTDDPEKVMKEILHWTGGQPFLTQKVCYLVTQLEENITQGDEKQVIEDLVNTKIINGWEYQDNPHLGNIKNRIFANQELISPLLHLYRQVLILGEIELDNSDEQIYLILSGLVVNQQGKIKSYNLIYQYVFNQQWIEEELHKLRPYNAKILAWEKSEFKDQSYLLQGKELKRALDWSLSQPDLENLDIRFLSESKILDKRQIKLKKIKKFGLWLLSGMMIAYLLFSAKEVINNYKLEACYGIIKVGDTCFRSVMTSGESKFFLSPRNFYLDKGIKHFKNKNYAKAKDLFDEAKKIEPKNSIPWIYSNNAVARLQNSKPYKFAAVVPADNDEFLAKELLRGVADAQYKFNKSGGKNNRLLEIVLVNDGNEVNTAEKIAEKIVKDREILAVIGHYSSDSSLKALPIYSNANLAMISTTSINSTIDKERKDSKNKVFFRTIPNVIQFAEHFADYLIKQNIKEVVIFYEKTSAEHDERFSEDYRKEFVKKFKELGGKVDINGYGIANENENLDTLDNTQLHLNDEDNFNPEQIIKNIEEAKGKKNQVKAIIVLGSVKTSSVATLVAQANSCPHPPAPTPTREGGK